MKIEIDVTGPLSVLLGGSLRLLPPEPKGRVIVTAVFDGKFSAKAEGNHMAYTLPDDHLVNVSIEYVDAHGHPAKVDGPVVWTSSDEAVATVSVASGNSQIATIYPGGTLGTAQITATADADIGEGVTSLITLLDVTTVAGAAVSGVITPGEALPIP